MGARGQKKGKFKTWTTFWIVYPLYIQQERVLFLEN